MQMTATSVYRRAALLRSDGSIVDADVENLLDPEGTFHLNISFDSATQDIYVVVEHRSHLSLMTAAAVVIDSSGNYVFDLSTQSGIFGSRDSAVQRSGIWAAAAGDTNGDGAIAIEDVLTASQAQGSSGYNARADVDASNLVSDEDAQAIVSNQGKRNVDPLALGQRGDEVVNVDLDSQRHGVGGLPNAQCASNVTGACRYGLDVGFLSPRYDSASRTLTFSIAVRAQQDLNDIPIASISQDDLGNVLGNSAYSLYYDFNTWGLAADELATGAGRACTIAHSAQAFSGDITINRSARSIVSMFAENFSAGLTPASAVRVSQDSFQPIFDISCVLPASVPSTGHASFRFANIAANQITNLYGNAAHLSALFATRYVNSLEYFPLDGTSIYIEDAYLADTNRHALITFNRDLPDDLSAVTFSMHTGFYDQQTGLPIDPNASVADAIASTHVIRLSSQTVWVIFPRNNLDILDSALLIADFQGDDNYVSADYQHQARYRVSAPYGAFSQNNSKSPAYPPRISKAAFTEEDTISIEFDQEVSGEPRSETAIAIEDFQILYWDAEGTFVEVTAATLSKDGSVYKIQLPADIVTTARGRCCRPWCLFPSEEQS